MEFLSTHYSFSSFDFNSLTNSAIAKKYFHSTYGWQVSEVITAPQIPKFMKLLLVKTSKTEIHCCVKGWSLISSWNPADRPLRNCEGNKRVQTSGSTMSKHKCIEFTQASPSQRVVSNTFFDKHLTHNVFLKADLADLIKPSYQPPHHGEWGTKNFQDGNNWQCSCCSWVAALTNVLTSD